MGNLAGTTEKSSDVGAFDQEGLIQLASHGGMLARLLKSCIFRTSCLSSSCLLVMLLMLTCSMDMLVARGVLIGLCGMFLGVSASFLLFACVGVVLVLRCGLEHVH